MENNLNIDARTLEMCLKETSKFGETVYQNVCTGQLDTVPWGGVDWLAFVFLTFIVLGIVFLILLGLFKAIIDY